MLGNALIFIAQVVFGLLTLTLLLRFYLQWVRAPYRNPLADFVNALTDFMVRPARRVLPGLWGIDLPTLNDRISSWSADAIFVYGWSWKAHLKAMRHFHGKIPIYFRGDSTLLDEQPGLKRCLRRIFLRWVYSHVDITFYVGERNKSYYKAMGLNDRV